MINVVGIDITQLLLRTNHSLHGLLSQTHPCTTRESFRLQPEE